MGDDKQKGLDSTAELLDGIDDSVTEYNFSIDDILAEFGIERDVDAEEEPDVPDERQPKDVEQELTDALRDTLEEMRSDQEMEQLRGIKEDLMKADEPDEGPSEDAPFDDETTDELPTDDDTAEAPHKKRKRLFGRDKDGAGDEQKQQVEISRGTADMSKMFGNDFEKYFGDERPVEEKKRRRKKFKSEKELERELFGGDSPVIPGSPDRTPVNELAEEDISPDDMAQQLIARLGRSRVRLLAAVLLAGLLALITFAPTIGWELPTIFVYRKTPFMYLFVNILLQVSVMLLCIETTSEGVRALVLLKPNMESVVTFAGFASLIHMLSVILFPQWGGYLPYTSVTAAAHLFTAYYGYRETLARLKSCKTANGTSRPCLVCREPALYEGEDGITKYRVKEPRFFVNQLEKPDAARKAWAVAAPIVIVGSLVFAAIASFGRGVGTAFPWALAAISAAAAPFSLMLPFSLTFAKAARRLGLSGAAIAGWAAAEDFGEVPDIVVSDSDIFPPGSITLNKVTLYGKNSIDRVITYAASLMDASRAGIARPFLDLLSEHAGKTLRVKAFKFYENGGIGGEIDDSTVLAGTAAFMLRTGIKIPDDMGGKPLIFLAINLELAGIFSVNYTASPAVTNGLRILARHNITPIFAVRDFNITPSMIEARFKLSTDTVDFPKTEERLALSDTERLYFAKPSAVVSREGLGNYVETVVTARNLRRAVKVCLALSLCGVALGMLIMFYLAFAGSPQTATPSNLFLFMLAWLAPIHFASRWVNS